MNDDDAFLVDLAKKEIKDVESARQTDRIPTAEELGLTQEEYEMNFLAM